MLLRPCATRDILRKPPFITEANNNSEFNVEAPVFIPKNLGIDSGKAETGDSEEVDTDNEETWEEQPNYTNQVYISLFCDSTF